MRSDVHKNVLVQAQKHFKPEFLNSLSELVIFQPLSLDKLKEVAVIQMNGIIARAAAKGITLRASDAALDVVLSESHNPVCTRSSLYRHPRILTLSSSFFFGLKCSL